MVGASCWIWIKCLALVQAEQLVNTNFLQTHYFFDYFERFLSHFNILPFVPDNWDLDVFAKFVSKIWDLCPADFYASSQVQIVIVFSVPIRRVCIFLDKTTDSMFVFPHNLINDGLNVYHYIPVDPSAIFMITERKARSTSLAQVSLFDEGYYPAFSIYIKQLHNWVLKSQISDPQHDLVTAQPTGYFSNLTEEKPASRNNTWPNPH